MKAPKLLKVFVAFLICLSLVRASVGSGPLSLYSVIDNLRGFEFDFSNVTNLIVKFNNRYITSGIFTWNNSLDGIVGFCINLRNLLVSLYFMVVDITEIFFVGVWTVSVNFLRFIGSVLNIAFKLIGLPNFNFEMTGYRGGR